jgi:hypothetical protein
VVFEGAEGSTSSAMDSADWVGANQSAFGIRVKRKTAPRPVLGVIDQFSLQRVHVHVVEFFYSLIQTPHIKVVKPALPKTGQRIAAVGEEQTPLCGGRSLLAAQAARDALFQNLNCYGRRCCDRLADQ